MSLILAPSDIDVVWENLRIQHEGLPPELRPPQRDALYWLSQDKNVIICIGTGEDDHKKALVTIE